MTTQEFAAILPAYQGAKMKFNLSTPYYKFICLIAGHEGTEWNTIYCLDEHGQLFEHPTKTMQYFKLCLRSFDQITDEECVKVCNLLWVNNGHLIAQGRELMQVYWRSSRCNVRPCDWVRVINYLRSIGIDCDGILNSPFGIKEDNNA